MIDLKTALPSHLSVLDSIIRRSIDSMERNGIFQWDTLYPIGDDFGHDIEEQTLFIITVDGIECGCICINETECPEYVGAAWEHTSFKVVHRLVVSPEFQGKGVGCAAMRFAEHITMAHGRKSIRLDAFAENPAALSLYRKLGYSVRGSAQFRKGLFYLFEKSLG